MQERNAKSKDSTKQFTSKKSGKADGSVSLADLAKQNKESHTGDAKSYSEENLHQADLPVSGDPREQSYMVQIWELEAKVAELEEKKRKESDRFYEQFRLDKYKEELDELKRDLAIYRAHLTKGPATQKDIESTKKMIQALKYDLETLRKTGGSQEQIRALEKKIEEYESKLKEFQ
ncbi:hypothetical protein L0222_11970 [bacterium]|nr:hypothetical protein [bacterium]MCI0604988.1 hypothetical protein [bacterium]